MKNPTDKIIYDFGANQGLNLPYYLKKAVRVVAVEANPSLCVHIQNEFKEEIRKGRLFVENCVLTSSENVGEVDFYLHRNYPVLSQFPVPDLKKQNEFKKVRLPSKSVRAIFQQYGSPFYLKIDLEHMDEVILRAVFEANIRPPYISAECHSIEVFALLVGLGRYQSFNLVDGLTVSQKYGSSNIETANGIEPYRFLEHSAGPFGMDIQNPWMTAENFFKYLAWEGLGWKDVHATTEIEPDPKAAPLFREYVKRALKNRLKRWSLRRANA